MARREEHTIGNSSSRYCYLIHYYTPIDEDPDENTMTIMSDCGIAEFELEDAGIRINRMITFVGGATAENFLHQLRILYITACQTQGDLMTMKIVSIKKKLVSS